MQVAGKFSRAGSGCSGIGDGRFIERGAYQFFRQRGKRQWCGTAAAGSEGGAGAAAGAKGVVVSECVGLGAAGWADAAALVASMALAAALTAGLFAFFTATATAALLPLALGGVAMIASGRIFAMLSGLLLLASACAGWSAGLSAPLLTLLAASLFGAGLYRRVSSRRALAPASP